TPSGVGGECERCELFIKKLDVMF
ncbi:MAG: hypothetical protein UZ10_BCD003000013, partial [Bacteroidetes bacterium OLB10]